MKYGIEKTIAAAVEPIIDDLVALEKKVAALEQQVQQLSNALDKQLQARDAEMESKPKRAARTRAPRVTSESAPH